MLVLRAKCIALWPISIHCDPAQAANSGEEEEVQGAGRGRTMS